MLHRGCITDPQAKQLWRDYRRVIREGNPLGLSFVEYIAYRIVTAQPLTYTAAAAAPWYVAECGHQHQWGATCNTVTQ